MAFSKAMAAKVYMKATFYGPQGSGKTFTSLLLAERLATFRGGRIAYVDTENGTKGARQRVPSRAIHPEAFDFDVLHTRSLAQILEELRQLNPSTHSVVVIDSISHLWDAAREAWEEKNPGRDDIPLRAWASIKRPYKALMRWVVESPFDVFVLGRQKNIFGKDADGDLVNEGVGMRAEGETQYEPDWCFRMFNVGERGGESLPALFCEKDRFGVMQGRTYTAPTGELIVPLLQFLGTDAPPREDEDERRAADAELLDDSKAAAKATKSLALYEEISPLVHGAQSVEDLVAVEARIKKDKRYLTDSHLGALRVAYQSRRDSIMAQAVPEL